MKKFLSIFVILILLAAVLISCGEGNGSSDNKGNDGAIRLYAIDNLSDYVVVRGENSSEAETKLTTSLRNAINETTGANVGIKTDYYNSKYEILVGNTKRQQSIDAATGLGYNDYTIKKDGNKVVVVGGSDKALSEAVELFMSQFIDAERKVVKIPSGNGFTQKTEKLFDKLTLNGVDVSTFSVFNKTSLSTNDFLNDISLLFNADIKNHDGEMSENEHYIIIEATELIADKYSIKIEDGNIVINGSSHSIEAALDAFKNDFIPSLGARTYDLTAADNFEGSTGKKELYTKDQLMAVIEKVYADPDHIIIGEQVCGNPQGAHNIAESIELFKTATGQMPGIMGIDLACYGLNLPGTDDATWSAYICDIVDYVADGGIITASAHWANPSGNLNETYDTCRGHLGYENSLAAYEKAFTDLITEGTEYNTEFKKELETNARFFKALEGNGVSIIWRPLHEANGNWFWFCVGQQNNYLDAKYIVDLWHYIYDYFENECGLSNLIWCYGPNWSENIENDPQKGTMSPTYLYPGDEYCDMVGVDWYTDGNLEIAKKDNYLLLAEMSGKPAAITEFGTSG
ncbi:MAG: hypothetical protein IKK94_02155, partial [Clostridia bacterium]|nr:hypothetical protein [Clostridia bacterium]